MKSIKLILIAVLVLSVGGSLMAQQDTIWYNSKWKKVSNKTEAAFFRPPLKKEGDLYRVEDYYVSGKPQMSALSKYTDKDFWHGKVTWYNADGSMLQQGTYKENSLHGEYISYVAGEKVVSNYENGVYVSGRTNINYGSYYVYLEEIESGFRRVYHAGDLKGIRYEEYLDKDKNNIFTKYYNKKGEYVGESKETNNGQKTGLVVYYNYKPFRLSSIQYYSKNAIFLGTSTYYKNGNLKEGFIDKSGYKTIYYSPQGDVIGTLTYEMRDSYLSPKDGTKFIFYSNYYGAKKLDENKETWPSSITTYENGKIVRYEEQYENKVTKSISTYVNNRRDLDVFYDEKGKETARLTYKNNKAYNGVQFNRDVKNTYKDGVLLEQIKYYPETNKKFMQQKDAEETYYDKEGKVLGVLKLDEDNYNTPLDGLRYSYFNGVYERIEQYKGGKIVGLTTLRKGREEAYYKKIEEFDARGYNKIREINFYSNKKIQSDVIYKKYNPIKGIYFNMKGDQIGVYDYMLKEGTRYKFFPTSDQIEEMEERKNNKLVRNLKYARVYNNRNQDFQIVVDVDSSKEAKFYNREGKLIAKASFKSGELYEGTVYDSKERSLYQIKEGKKNGTYERYNYQENIIEKGNFKNDLEEGFFVNYNASGAKMSSINYIGGKPEGDAVYYNEEGKVLSKMNYKNGKPYSGKITISNDYGATYKEETYVNGSMVQSIDSKKEGKMVTDFKSETIKVITKYYLDSDKKYLTYELENGTLQGDVVSYAKDGKIERKAEFKDGKFVAGKVRLKGGYNNGQENYLLLIRTDTTFTVEKYNASVLEYKAFEKLEKGMRSEHIYKLDSKINYIYPDDIE
ncbi:hypothetical protein [Maribacter sp.]|uniref:toxin-antitoxin system YwqK family antitoxin n=1 Tax=Maribacter sp. TaxID=1897614 RepID=UPI0025BEAAFA|nr:hypothetical protein [Maribacter sp.]